LEGQARLRTVSCVPNAPVPFAPLFRVSLTPPAFHPPDPVNRVFWWTLLKTFSVPTSAASSGRGVRVLKSVLEALPPLSVSSIIELSLFSPFFPPLDLAHSYA